MRGIEKKKLEIKRRQKIYTEMKSLQKKIIAEISACVACTLLIVLVGCFIPELTSVSAQAPMKQYGSMILSLPSIGYVLIAVLFFILGVIATLLCQHIKKRQEKENEI